MLSIKYIILQSVEFVLISNKTAKKKLNLSVSNTWLWTPVHLFIEHTKNFTIFRLQQQSEQNFLSVQLNGFR